MNSYEMNSTILLKVEFRDTNGNLTNPTTVTATVTSPTGVIFIPDTINNPSTGEYNFLFVSIAEEGEFTYSFLGVDAVSSQRESGFFAVVNYNKSNLDYLIPQLRDHLGDRDSRVYNTDLLRQNLLSAVKVLIPRFNYKYMFTSANTVARNSAATNGTFQFGEPPVIEYQDERPIILQASIDIKEGIIITNWNLIGSWRDDEISSSNIQGGSMLSASVARDIQELDMLLPDRSRKLAHVRKTSLLGYGELNIFEH